MSWLLPSWLQLYWASFETAFARWGSTVAVAVAAGAFYAVLAWRLKWDWNSVLTSALRLGFAVELVAALTLKFWVVHRGAIWGVVWLVASLATISGLVANSERAKQASCREPSGRLLDEEVPQFMLDVPVSDPKEDAFNRRPLSTVLVRHIMNHSAPYSFTLALNSRWGTGKTSVMKFMQVELEERGFKTRWVNAWIYDSKVGIWRGVVKAIIELLVEYHIPVAPYTAMKRYYKIASELLKSTGSTSAKAVAGLAENLPTTDDLAEVKDEVGKLVRDLVADSKLVVFIDDLDRCSPESVLGTLEFLKEVTDFRQCVFVVGLDIESVVPLLEPRYHERAREFLHKVINVSVDLNELPGHRLIEYFQPFVEQTTGFTGELARAELMFLTRILDFNPRAVKQVLNGFIVARSLLDHLFDLGSDEYVRALLAVQIIRFSFPTVHKALQDEIEFARLNEQYILFRSRATERRSFRSEQQAEPEQAWHSYVAQRFALGAPHVQKLLSVLEHSQLLDGPLAVSTVPRSVLFSYLDPPAWLSESRVIRLLRGMSEGTMTIDEVVFDLQRDGPDKVGQLAARCINLKSNLYRSWIESYVPVQHHVVHDDLQTILLEIIGYQVRTGRQVMPLDSLRQLIGTEFRYAPATAEAFARRLLEPKAWPASVLYEWAVSFSFRLPGDSVLPKAQLSLMNEVKLHSGRVVMREQLESLGTRVTDDLFMRHLSSLESELLADEETHRAIVEIAFKHRDDPNWIAQFRVLIHSWIGWEKTVGEVTRVRHAWVRAVDRGLLTCLRAVVRNLTLREEAAVRLANDLEHLEQMTGVFRASLGDSQPEGEPEEEPF